MIRQVRRAYLGASVAAALMGLLGCDAGEVRFGPKPGSESKPDAAVARVDYELDLQLLGDRRHRVVSAIRGRDVRRLLPARRVTLRRGARVFAVVPVGRNWKRVVWRAARVESVDRQQRFTVRLEEGRLFDGLPGAMILRAGRSALKAGQVVRVHVGRGLPFGRIREVKGGQVWVRTTWLGATRDVRVSRHEVLRVSSGLQMAGPVVYRVETTHRLGSLVASERKHRWVLGAEGVVHKLPWNDVKAIRFGRRFKSGDQVRAALPVSLRLVSVIRAMDDGVRYEVGWSQTRRSVVAFSALAPP